METCLAMLERGGSSQPPPPRHGRRSVKQPCAPPAAPPQSVGIHELTQLEEEAKERSRRVRLERRRISSLRRALAESELAPPSPPEDPSPSACAVSVRPGASGATDLLNEAIDKRAALLRKQAPLLATQLVRLESERQSLEKVVATSSEATAIYARLELDDSQREVGLQPHALLRQLHSLNSKLTQRTNQLDAPEQPHVAISIFADGLMLYRGPFRPFDSAEAKLFGEQLMGGY
ncbi:MAG: hypothetical protein SGPRY_007095, partial [Prymnesium sp.]